MDKNKKKQKGFTLVELSIVLVIIGLIVSSVLVGQDLVRAAELRNIVSQYQSFTSAVGTFRTRHDNGLPGDVDGTDYGYDATGGNGDRILTDGTFTDFANDDVRDVHGGELVGFWNHLGSTSTGLINGSFDGVNVDGTAGTINDHVPSTRSGESWGVFSDTGINYFVLGTVESGADSDYSTEAVYSPKDSADIDSKIDDGRPTRGMIRAKGASASDPDAAPTAGATAGSCVDVNTAAGVYATAGDATRDIIACTLRFTIK